MGASSSYSYTKTVDRLLLLPLNSDIVPHLPLLVLLGDLLNDWCEVSTVLRCQFYTRRFDRISLPAPMWSIASLVVLGVGLIAGMPFAYGMHGRMTLLGIVGQLPDYQFPSSVISGHKSSCPFFHPDTAPWAAITQSITTHHPTSFKVLFSRDVVLDSETHLLYILPLLN